MMDKNERRQLTVSRDLINKYRESKREYRKGTLPFALWKFVEDEVDFVVSWASHIYNNIKSTNDVENVMEILDLVDTSENPMALAIKSDIYYFGYFDYPQDKVKAYELSLKAVKNGSDFAKNVLGRSYIDGEVVDKDIIKGISLIRQSAFSGNQGARNFMAKICHDDIYDEETQDRRQEYFWRNLQILELNRNKDLIMYHAYNIMELSYDMFINKKEGLNVLKIAAALGDERAQEIIDRIEEEAKDNLVFDRQKNINKFVDEIMIENKNYRGIKNMFDKDFKNNALTELNLEELIKIIFPGVWSTVTLVVNYHLGKFNNKADNKTNYEKFKTKFIEIILSSKNKEDNTANNIIEKIHNDSEIQACFKDNSADYDYKESIGLIQKLVNMLFKYLYAIINYKSNIYTIPESLKKNIEEHFNFNDDLDCPIDSKIFGEIYKNKYIKLQDYGIEKIVKTVNYQIKFPKIKTKPWSRLTLDEYNKVQKFLEDYMDYINKKSAPDKIKNLLELDFYLWER